MLLGCERLARLPARLERRLGRFAIPNLIWYVVGAMAVVWLLRQARPDVEDRLYLDAEAVMHGEVWRLVTFLTIPPPWSMWWVLVGLYFAWWVGSSLGEHRGGRRVD